MLYKIINKAEMNYMHILKETNDAFDVFDNCLFSIVIRYTIVVRIAPFIILPLGL